MNKLYGILTSFNGVLQILAIIMSYFEGHNFSYKLGPMVPLMNQYSHIIYRSHMHANKGTFVI